MYTLCSKLSFLLQLKSCFNLIHSVVDKNLFVIWGLDINRKSDLDRKLL